MSYLTLDFECEDCEVLYERLLVKHEEISGMMCDACMGPLVRLYTWDGACDGMDSGSITLSSTGQQFEHNKEMREHFLSRRKHKPGEYIGDDKNGNRQYAADLMHPSSEKVHGARNESHLDFGKKIITHGTSANAGATGDTK